SSGFRAAVALVARVLDLVAQEAIDEFTFQPAALELLCDGGAEAVEDLPAWHVHTRVASQLLEIAAGVLSAARLFGPEQTVPHPVLAEAASLFNQGQQAKFAQPRVNRNGTQRRGRLDGLF